MLVSILSGCTTLRDSLILGASSGTVAGAVAGAQVDGNRSENALKGAVLGGIVGGVTSYLMHGSLESRDARVRKDTLLNLEKFDVLGRESVMEMNERRTRKNDKCFTTREVDGRVVSIPCRYVDDPNESAEGKE